MASDPVEQAANGIADGKLVQRTLAGDRTAFDELVAKYQRQAVAVSFRLLGNTNDALEVTQDSFLKAYKSLDQLQKPEAFGGWLMRIVSNLSLNFRRGRKLRQSQTLDDVVTATASAEPAQVSADEGDPFRTLASREMGDQLKAALEKLPEKQRLAIVMFTVQEMPQKDVAEALECSVEAVKWHVFQGRKKLKEMLKDYLESQ